MKPIQSTRSNGSLKPAWVLPATLILGTLCLVAIPRGGRSSPGPSSASTWGQWWKAPGSNLKTHSDDQGASILETNWGRPIRSYRRWTDSEGRIQEHYEEQGVAKPVDEQVRSWVDATLKQAKPPIPPNPPTPPEPPAPPEPPPFGRTEAGQEILNRVQNDLRLVAMVGSPMQASPTFEGRLHHWGPGEPHGSTLLSRLSGIDVDVSIPVSGPKGAAVVHAKGQFKQGLWTFSVLDARSPQNGTHLDLLSK